MLAREGQRLCGKVLVLVTEDWFALSHFRPLIATLREMSTEVVVATRSSGRLEEIAALGVRTRAFDFRRGSANPLAHVQALGGLAALIGEERPDAIHAIAMQPMVLTCLALQRGRYRPRGVVLHLTGLGFLGVSRSPVARLARPVAFAVLRRTFRTHNVRLLAENPDDVAYMIAAGAGTPAQAAVVPGAGIDPQQFPALPPPGNATPAAAFVGRMLHQKGAAVLVEAQRRLSARGIAIHVDLY
ncbi:MAG: glycosyltransferase, partial [Hyphomicrobiaceae bacterium]